MLRRDELLIEGFPRILKRIKASSTANTENFRIMISRHTGLTCVSLNSPQLTGLTREVQDIKEENVSLWVGNYTRNVLCNLSDIIEDSKCAYMEVYKKEWEIDEAKLLKNMQEYVGG